MNLMLSPFRVYTMPTWIPCAAKYKAGPKSILECIVIQGHTTACVHLQLYAIISACMLQDGFASPVADLGMLICSAPLLCMQHRLVTHVKCYSTAQTFHTHAAKPFPNTTVHHHLCFSL